MIHHELNILWSETKLNCLGRSTRHCSSSASYHWHHKAWWWQHHTVGVIPELEVIKGESTEGFLKNSQGHRELRPVWWFMFRHQMKTCRDSPRKMQSCNCQQGLKVMNLNTLLNVSCFISVGYWGQIGWETAKPEIVPLDLYCTEMTNLMDIALVCVTMQNGKQQHPQLWHELQLYCSTEAVFQNTKC